jgi:hypothetical protein
VTPLANLENCIYPPSRHNISPSPPSSQGTHPPCLLPPWLPRQQAASREPSSKLPCRRARVLLPWRPSLLPFFLQQAAPFLPPLLSMASSKHPPWRSTPLPFKRSCSRELSSPARRNGRAAQLSFPIPMARRICSLSSTPWARAPLSMDGAQKIFQLLPRRPSSPRARSSRSHFPCSALFFFVQPAPLFHMAEHSSLSMDAAAARPGPTPLLGQQPSRPYSPARSPLRSSSRTFPAAPLSIFPLCSLCGELMCSQHLSLPSLCPQRPAARTTPFPRSFRMCARCSTQCLRGRYVVTAPSTLVGYLLFLRSPKHRRRSPW